MSNSYRVVIESPGVVDVVEARDAANDAAVSQAAAAVSAAAALVSQTAASASEATATTQAGIATTKAGEAAASETAAETARDEALASATSAAASSAAAGVASGRLVITAFAQLATDFVYSAPGAGQQAVAAGDVVVDEKTGNRWEVLAAGASGAHLDYTGTGGVKLSILRSADGVDVRAAGAVGDGVTDDAPAFIIAREAANGQKIRVPSGVWKLNQVVTGTSDFILEGDGDTTVLDFSGTVTGGSYGLEAIGEATQIEELSGTQSAGLNTVTFASAPSLEIGDIFVIYNPTDFSWSGFREDYRAGEWCEVENVSGSVVTVKGQLYDTYDAADVDVYKITGPKVSLRNFKIIGTTVIGLISASLCIDPLVENVSAEHANNSIVRWDRCFRPRVINPNFRNVGDGGDDYGISIANSQHSRILGGNVFSRRHAVTNGGGSSICSVPVRDCRVIGSVLKNDPAAGVFAADFHGNTEDSSYIDCSIYGGATWQGKDVEYVNCTITADSGGRVMYSGEIKGGKFGLRGCKLITHVNPQPGGRGIIDVGGNNAPITANTVLPCYFAVADCDLYARNMTSSSVFMLLENSGSSAKTNIVIDGLRADVNLFGTALRTGNNSGTAAADYIIVDRIAGLPSGVFLHYSVSSAYTNFPHRCQRQTGSASLEATSGTNIRSGSAVTFKYSYPRAPSAQAGGVTALSSNVAALPCIGAVSATGLTPGLISADATNWSATSTVTVGWQACIDEV